MRLIAELSACPAQCVSSTRLACAVTALLAHHSGLTVWRIFVCVTSRHVGYAHPEFFLGGGGGVDREAVYNLCLILKIMLQKSFRNYNITLPATACIYTQT
jgi:hypothetical protein